RRSRASRPGEPRAGARAGVAGGRGGGRQGRPDPGRSWGGGRAIGRQGPRVIPERERGGSSWTTATISAGVDGGAGTIGVRIAGLPVQALDRLRCGEAARQVEEILDLDARLATEATALGDELHGLI